MVDVANAGQLLLRNTTLKVIQQATAETGGCVMVILHFQAVKVDREVGLYNTGARIPGIAR